jgi:deoxyadenosine/deoxycytidine kinase
MMVHKIGVVGPCAAGKSTLIAKLKQHGYEARHIAQEHSYVANMWKRITNPDVLIYLDVSYYLTLERRNMNWTEAEYAEQLRRLAHAREHADLYIETNPLTADEVFQVVLNFLESLEEIS